MQRAVLYIDKNSPSAVAPHAQRAFVYIDKERAVAVAKTLSNAFVPAETPRYENFFAIMFGGSDMFATCILLDNTSVTFRGSSSMSARYSFAEDFGAVFVGGSSMYASAIIVFNGGATFVGGSTLSATARLNDPGNSVVFNSSSSMTCDSPVVGEFRLLSEVDTMTVETLDDMSLEDIDYKQV